MWAVTAAWQEGQDSDFNPIRIGVVSFFYAGVEIDQLHIRDAEAFGQLVQTLKADSKIVVVDLRIDGGLVAAPSPVV